MQQIILFVAHVTELSCVHSRQVSLFPASVSITRLMTLAIIRTQKN